MSGSESSPQVTRIEGSSSRQISQNVIGSNNEVHVVRQQLTDSATLGQRLEVKFPKRQSTYYSVTEAEIQVYAQLGWISTISLTLFGTLAGVALGCFVALQQSNLPAEAIAILNTLAWVTGVVSIIFLAFTIAFIYFQSQSKKAWDSVE